LDDNNEDDDDDDDKREEEGRQVRSSLTEKQKLDRLTIDDAEEIGAKRATMMTKTTMTRQ
jgi:hypothetical protein